MSLNDCRKIVYDKLIALCPRVYYQQAPQGAVFPYVVFVFPTEGRQYKHQVERMLEVNVYDSSDSGYNVALEIENLTDSIDKVLDYQTGNYGDIRAWFRRIGRTAIPYPSDSNIWRRELLYVYTTYNMGE